MMPGGRMNPRQMKAMMKRLGISQEEIADVEEVVIRTKTKELVFEGAAVTAMMVQGQKTYQVVGEPKERPRKREKTEEEKGHVPDDDVKLVMEQTGCTAEQARKALKECDGAPAEAILRIMAAQ